MASSDVPLAKDRQDVTPRTGVVLVGVVQAMSENEVIFPASSSGVLRVRITADESFPFEKQTPVPKMFTFGADPEQVVDGIKLLMVRKPTVPRLVEDSTALRGLCSRVLQWALRRLPILLCSVCERHKDETENITTKKKLKFNIVFIGFNFLSGVANKLRHKNQVQPPKNLLPENR